MSSLRRELKVRLFPLYLVVSLCAAITTYISYGKTVHEFMDDQLLGLAQAHAAQPPLVLEQLSPQELHSGRMLVQVFSSSGQLLATACPDADVERAPAPGFDTVRGPGGAWRVYSLPIGDRVIQTAQQMAIRSFIIRQQTLRSALPVALLIPISAMVLWMTIGLALRPLNEVATEAGARNEHDLRELTTENVPEEVLPLVTSMNRLLVRLNDAFSGQRRFVQDAAHELRTPITALSLQLENLKTRVSDPEAMAQVAQLEAGLSRTRRLVEQLLRLARQEGPVRERRTESIDVGHFARDVIAELVPLADKRSIEVGMSKTASVQVDGGADDLHCVLHNLLDNAFRYTPMGGIVDVALTRTAGEATLEIIDTGPGVAQELLPRVFDRFFRVAGSNAEGSGLGLAIAKHAAERNGWTLTLANRTDRSGLLARVTFPVRVSESAMTGADGHQSSQGSREIPVNAGT
jgi:two-component system OmpR family sensor kinase